MLKISNMYDCTSVKRLLPFPLKGSTKTPVTNSADILLFPSLPQTQDKEYCRAEQSIVPFPNYMRLTYPLLPYTCPALREEY